MLFVGTHPAPVTKYLNDGLFDDAAYTAVLNSALLDVFDCISDGIRKGFNNAEIVAAVSQHLHVQGGLLPMFLELFLADSKDHCSAIASTIGATDFGSRHAQLNIFKNIISYQYSNVKMPVAYSRILGATDDEILAWRVEVRRQGKHLPLQVGVKEAREQLLALKY